MDKNDLNTEKWADMGPFSEVSVDLPEGIDGRFVRTTPELVHTEGALEGLEKLPPVERPRFGSGTAPDGEYSGPVSQFAEKASIGGVSIELGTWDYDSGPWRKALRGTGIAKFGEEIPFGDGVVRQTFSISPTDYLNARAAVAINATRRIPTWRDEYLLNEPASIATYLLHAESMESGDQFPTPRFHVNENGEILPHTDGRTRGLAALYNGYDKMPVAIIHDPDDVYLDNMMSDAVEYATHGGAYQPCSGGWRNLLKAHKNATIAYRRHIESGASEISESIIRDTSNDNWREIKRTAGWVYRMYAEDGYSIPNSVSQSDGIELDPTTLSSKYDASEPERDSPSIFTRIRGWFGL